MTANYSVSDQSGTLLFKMPNFDRDLRMDDLLDYNGTVYKVESALVKLVSYGPTPGNAIPGYSQPVVEIVVSVVP